MDDEQLLRYSRQIMLPQIDIKGQEKLLSSHALIIGLGGLGSPVALYLAAAGVGRLTLVDHDQVDLSNLQRQVIHTSADIGRDKVESARDQILAINPDCQVNCIPAQLSGEALLEQVHSADIAIECSDNFSSRFALNQACVKTGAPLVSGAVIRMEGQLGVFDTRDPSAPCYACLYREEGEDENRCSETGVLAPVAGLIGSLQATETLKLLLDIPVDTGRLLLIDAERMQFRSMKLKKDPDCPVCGQYLMQGL
jgi:adenylyltransferase/sulfurtransferase